MQSLYIYKQFPLFAVTLFSQKFWSKLVDIVSSVYLILLMLISVTNISSVLQSWDWKKNQCKGRWQDAVTAFFYDDFEILIPLLHLVMVVGFCLDNGTSWNGRLFRLKPLQFLGKISFSLYMVHPIVIQLVHRYLYYSWRNIIQSKSLLKNLGDVPIEIAISILLATVLTYFIEEPMRKILSERFLNIEKNKGH